MAKGDRKKQQQQSKNAGVQQENSSQNEAGLNRSKKQGHGKHTDRPDSNQDEDSTLVEQTQPDNKESSSSRMKNWFSNFCFGVAFFFALFLYAFVYVIQCIKSGFWRFTQLFVSKPKPSVDLESEQPENPKKRNKKK